MELAWAIEEVMVLGFPHDRRVAGHPVTLIQSRKVASKVSEPNCILSIVDEGGTSIIIVYLRLVITFIHDYSHYYCFYSLSLSPSLPGYTHAKKPPSQTPQPPKVDTMKNSFGRLYTYHIIIYIWSLNFAWFF